MEAHQTLLLFLFLACLFLTQQLHALVVSDDHESEASAKPDTTVQDGTSSTTHSETNYAENAGAGVETRGAETSPTDEEATKQPLLTMDELKKMPVSVIIFASYIFKAVGFTPQILVTLKLTSIPAYQASGA